MANPASQTAVGPMTIVAAEQYFSKEQRVVQDELAYHLLPASVKWIVRLTRWRPARNLLIQATEKTAQGIWGSVLCRKRFIDDKLQAAIGAIDAVVILGAGLDTRAYRMAQLSTIPVFEVDLPESIAFKRSKVQQLYGQLPATVHLVPIDFERQNLEMVLSEHGYRTDQRTFFVWEAVTQYLTDEAVRKTFDFLAKAASGSRLAFTYIRQDFIDGVNLYGAAVAYQRFRVKQQLWHFGMIPEQVAAFLDAYSWREVEQMGSQECVAGYIKSSGRDMPVSELERSVYAEKI
jgi:methyltransferase (TIGR00027 family)